MVSKEIIVNGDPRETRIAVREDGKLVELHIERGERVVARNHSGAGLRDREVVAVPLRREHDDFVPADARKHRIGNRIGFVRRGHEGGDRKHDSAEDNRDRRSEGPGVVGEGFDKLSPNGGVG